MLSRFSSFAGLLFVWDDDECLKAREAAAALVGAHGEAPGALGPLAIQQSMRSLFFLKLSDHTKKEKYTFLLFWQLCLLPARRAS
jgi:hypothetical protein